MLRLLVVRGDLEEDRLVLKESAVVGRGDDAGLVVAHPSVSRSHALLVRRPEGWYVEDLASTNGTFLNGARVDGRRPLEAGDVLAMGDVVLSVHEATEAEVEDTSEARLALARDPSRLPALRDVSDRLAAELTHAYACRRTLALVEVELVRPAGAALDEESFLEAAQVLRARMRSTDVLVRTGEGCLLAVVRDVSLPLAVRVARRLLRALHDHPLPTNVAPGRLGANVGVACSEGRWIEWRDLVAATRAARLRADERGGDRVCAARPDSGSLQS